MNSLFCGFYACFCGEWLGSVNSDGGITDTEGIVSYFGFYRDVLDTAWMFCLATG